MDLKRWILIAGFLLIGFLGVSTARMVKYRSQIDFQQRTDFTIDYIEDLENAKRYDLALDQLNRHTALTTGLLAGMGYSDRERDSFLQQWMDVAKVYKLRGRALGVSEDEMRAHLQDAIDRIMAVPLKDPAIRQRLEGGFKYLLAPPGSHA